MVIAQDIRL